MKTGRQDSVLQWLRRLIPEHSSINILGVQRRPLFLPVSPVGLPRVLRTLKIGGRGASVARPRSHGGPRDPLWVLGPAEGTVRALPLSGKVTGGQQSNSDLVNTNAHQPRGQRSLPAGPRWWQEGGRLPLTPISAVPISCPGPAASLWQLRQGLQGELAPGQHRADALPPKGLPPHPGNRLNRMPCGGAWKPSGKSTALAPVPREGGEPVCCLVCRSPDSRPRRLSTNGVCVGADGRQASWRQGPKGEGRVAGEWQQVGWSAEWSSAVSARCEGPTSREGPEERSRGTLILS